MSSTPSIAPRRSARIAARVAAAAAPPAPAPVEPTVAAPKKRRATKQERQPPTLIPLTADEMASELAVRQTLLTEAKSIRAALVSATTLEEIRSCGERADALWHVGAKKLKSGMMDLCDLSDCYHECIWDAVPGNDEHRYATEAIERFIELLEYRILVPPTRYIL